MSEITDKYTERVKSIHLDLARLENEIRSDRVMTDNVRTDDYAYVLRRRVTQASDLMRNAYYMVRNTPPVQS
jgi:hypothetical protein